MMEIDAKSKLLTHFIEEFYKNSSFVMQQYTDSAHKQNCQLLEELVKYLILEDLPSSKNTLKAFSKNMSLRTLMSPLSMIDPLDLIDSANARGTDW
jgi:hypothetical protein